MSAHFKSPPISEVVIATYFKPALEFSSEHVGLFWARIKSEFPMARQQPPVGAEIPVGNDIFPMPRYWFTADDGVSLLQIQKNAFMFNWRRQDDGYPRYHSIKPKFDKYYALFTEFVRTEVSTDPTIDVCELTYVNTIQQCDYWQGPQDTSRVIPFFSLLAPGIDDSHSVGFNCNFAFRTNDTIHLQIAARSGTRVQDPHVPVLVFEIKATEQVGSITKAEADDWFDRAHVVVMDCFLGMTSQTIQTDYWEREHSS